VSAPKDVVNGLFSSTTMPKRSQRKLGAYVIRNKKHYDVDSVLADVALAPVTIEQSKGRARMVAVPSPDDNIFVVCSGIAIMKGKVLRGFTHTTAHQTDVDNIGMPLHRVPDYSALIQLSPLPVPIQVRLSWYQTWVQKRLNEIRLGYLQDRYKVYFR